MFLTHGAGRRLGTLQTALREIFRYFPSSQAVVVPRDDLFIAQIHLQAFILNVSGVFDNWAWAFVHRHGLLAAIGDRRRVGMFISYTEEHLPAPLRDYLRQAHIRTWYSQYHKDYRDALAHRIPVHIPPAYFTEEEAQRHEELEAQKAQLIQAQDWQQLNVVWAEQDALGVPCPLFVHEYQIQGGAPYLHPQLLSDAKTVVEFGNLFYEAWQADQ